MRGRACIVTIGTVSADGQPSGWEFDCHPTIPVVEFRDDGVRFGGWGIDELRHIAASAPAAPGQEGER